MVTAEAWWDMVRRKEAGDTCPGMALMDARSSTFDGAAGVRLDMTTFRAAEGTRGLLVAALIVIGTTGCDNVEWGGGSVTLQPPPNSGEEDQEAVSDAPAPPSLPSGEFLFIVSPSGDRGTATALAFVDEGGAATVPPVDNPRLGPLLSNRLAGIGELTLFANGTRAGTALVSGMVEGEGACVGLPALDVGLELRARADEWPTLLAMPRSANQRWEHGDLAPPAQVRDVRAATLSMAGNMINEEGAVWPPSVIRIRRDIQLLSGPEGLGVAASFIYRDLLDLSPAAAGSYSIFVMGEERPDSVHQTYGDFHRSGTEGKQAPRYLASLDWDRDGEDEVVLEIYTEGQRNYRLLEREGAVYADALDVVCESPS